jgi:hypothetical protein
VFGTESTWTVYTKSNYEEPSATTNVCTHNFEHNSDATQVAACKAYSVTQCNDRQYKFLDQSSDTGWTASETVATTAKSRLFMHNEVSAILTTLATHLIAEEPNYVATTKTGSTTDHDWTGVGNGGTKGQSYVT